ncbi:hypothetical protein DPMN_137937 [Dreissena polymorpha]|uniref:Phosphatidylinositol-specific phospholipase C X domain-containing protein n=1 Tax=Dreissena polymorpha TaxID=45954 RepID=A0A9D4G5N2_DREPO|nr:hypothetical protein DPMN_137937 [Dreissena polymorpha]
MGNVIAKDPDFWCSTDDPGPERHNADWMKRVSDSKFLSELSIPGTHDTMTCSYSGVEGLWVWCQSWSLGIQLNMGIRFLDIRCQASNGDMLLNHGGYYLGTLLDTLNGCVNFLQTQPSECIILRIKQENSSLEGLGFRDAMFPFLERFSDHIFFKTSMLTLGEARGKMVILADYDMDGNDHIMRYGCGMSICDNWEPDSKEQKIDGIKDNINSAFSAVRDRKEMYITFTSYTWLADCPRELARSANPIAHDFVRNHIGCLGIFVMDYPGFQIIRDIIDHN